MPRQLPPAAHRFPTTQWSGVMRAGHAPTAVKRQALGELLERYFPAMRTHLIIRKRVRPDDANDLLQGFVKSRVLENSLIARADREKGKFRTFLLTALDRYMISEYRHASAKKRNSGPIADLAELPEPAARKQTPHDVFDIEWARGVLSQTIENMKQECRASGQDDVWGVFEFRLLGPILGQRPAPAYDQLVQHFQLQSPAQAANLLVTAKRMFARLMRSVIGQYALNHDEIDQEIHDLMQILSKHGN